MLETVKKLNIIKDEILSQGKKLRLLGLFHRNDNSGLKDLVVAGDWIEEGKSRETIKMLLEIMETKELELGESIEGIYAFSNEDNFLHHIARAFKENRVSEALDGTSEIKLFDDAIIDANIIHEDFDGFELNTTKVITRRESIASTSAF